ncbi:hypothetical protein D3C80_1200310 [compost metagenome]
MYAANHAPRSLGEEAGVQRKLGHQLGDKGLIADTGEVVSLAELHFEEVPAQAFPERRTACLIRHAAHLGNDLVAKQLGKLRNEQQARLGQQAAIEAAAIITAQEQ